jgi:cell division protein FtsN
MTEQHRIELAFSRPRFAVLIGTAVMTGFGLLAAGLFAGIEVGAVEAKAAIPRAIEDPSFPLPLQYPHELPVLEPADRQLARQYVVQAASFRDKGQAGKLAAALMERGYSAVVVGSRDQTGRSWLIVLVGPYPARAEASQAASELGRFARSAPIVKAVEN